MKAILHSWIIEWWCTGWIVESPIGKHTSRMHGVGWIVELSISFKWWKGWIVESWNGGWIVESSNCRVVDAWWYGWIVELSKKWTLAESWYVDEIAKPSNCLLVSNGGKVWSSNRVMVVESLNHLIVEVVDAWWYGWIVELSKKWMLAESWYVEEIAKPSFHSLVITSLVITFYNRHIGVNLDEKVGGPYPFL